jgi:uncharacterized protein (TIGR03435 family)
MSSTNFVGRIVVVVAVLVLLNAAAINSQDMKTENANSPVFEVVSVKLDRSGQGGSNRTRPMSSEQFSATNIPLESLIELAYRMSPFQVVGGPSWLRTDRYDVEAKIDDSLFKQLRQRPEDEQLSQFRLMLRALLSDRFKLTVSSRTDDLPVLDMVVSKNGPHIGGSGLKVVAPFANNTQGVVMVMGRGQDITIQGSAATMDNLARSLAISLGRKVINDTGLTETYNFSIHFADDTQTQPDAAPSDSSTPLVFAALENSLGLKLQRATGPVDVIVVDHVEKPSEN